MRAHTGMYLPADQQHEQQAANHCQASAGLNVPKPCRTDAGPDREEGEGRQDVPQADVQRHQQPHAEHNERRKQADPYER